MLWRRPKATNVKMSNMHVLKKVVTMLAFTMFIYQTSTAVMKYLESPTVDQEESTERNFEHRPR